MEELEIGKEYKLRELCELLDIEYKQGGKQRKLMLSKISRKYVIERIENKNSYIAISKSDYVEKDKAPNFMVNDTDKHKAGIYIIQKENLVYIGQTMDFYKRYYRHRTCHKYEYDIDTTKGLIDSGATFSALEIEGDLNKRLELERYYIISYIKQGYNVINERKRNLKEPKKRKPKTIKIKNVKLIKDKNKIIRISESDYIKVIELLEENNIKYK